MEIKYPTIFSCWTSPSASPPKENIKFGRICTFWYENMYYISHVASSFQKLSYFFILFLNFWRVKSPTGHDVRSLNHLLHVWGCPFLHSLHTPFMVFRVTGLADSLTLLWGLYLGYTNDQQANHWWNRMTFDVDVLY